MFTFLKQETWEDKFQSKTEKLLFRKLFVVVVAAVASVVAVAVAVVAIAVVPFFPPIRKLPLNFLALFLSPCIPLPPS